MNLSMKLADLSPRMVEKLLLDILLLMVVAAPLAHPHKQPPQSQARVAVCRPFHICYNPDTCMVSSGMWTTSGHT